MKCMFERALAHVLIHNLFQSIAYFPMCHNAYGGGDNDGAHNQITMHFTYDIVFLATRALMYNQMRNRGCVIVVMILN